MGASCSDCYDDYSEQILYQEEGEKVLASIKDFQVWEAGKVKWNLKKLRRRLNDIPLTVSQRSELNELVGSALRLMGIK